MPESATKILRTIAGRSIGSQPVLVFAHEWGGQCRELGGANQRRDVEREVLLVVHQRGALDAGRFPAREPQPSGFGHRDAAAVGGVDAGADIDRDLRMIGVGVALAGEGLEVPEPLVAVIDHPGLAALAAIGLPATLADGHGVSTISNYLRLRVNI